MFHWPETRILPFTDHHQRWWELGWEPDWEPDIPTWVQITWVSPEQSPAPRYYLNDRYNIITSNTGGALITSLSHTFIQSNHSEKPSPENHASWEPDKMRMVSWTRWLAADSWLWKLLYWSNCSEMDGKKPLLMWSMAWQSDYSLGLMLVVTKLSGSIEY